MLKGSRMYILKDSYPDSVDITSEKYKIDEHIDITSKEQFWANIGHWLALSKSPEFVVLITIRPSKCAMILWQHSIMYSTCGRINLKFITDIEYYESNGKDYNFIHRDVIAEHLNSDTELMKRAFVDDSTFDNENWRNTAKNNKDMATAGRNLVKCYLSEYLIDYNHYPQIPLQYFLENYLTDEKIAKRVATKYDLSKRIQKGNHIKKPQSQLLADCLYSVIWAIYEDTQSVNDIRQIVRMLIDDTEGQAENIREIYKKIGEYINDLSKKFGGQEIANINYEHFEKTTGIKMDYEVLRHTDMLRDFGYIITYVDLEDKIFYLEPSYW